MTAKVTTVYELADNQYHTVSVPGIPKTLTELGGEIKHLCLLSGIDGGSCEILEENVDMRLYPKKVNVHE